MAAAWTEQGRRVSTMTLAQLRELGTARGDGWRPGSSHGDTSLLTLDACFAGFGLAPASEDLRRDQASPSDTARWWKTSCQRCYTGSYCRTASQIDPEVQLVMSFSAAAVRRIRRAAPLLPTVFSPIPDQQCGHGGRGNRTRTACVKEYPQPR